MAGADDAPDPSQLSPRRGSPSAAYTSIRESRSGAIIPATLLRGGGPGSVASSAAASFPTTGAVILAPAAAAAGTLAASGPPSSGGLALVKGTDKTLAQLQRAQASRFGVTTLLVLPETLTPPAAAFASPLLLQARGTEAAARAGAPTVVAATVVFAAQLPPSARVRLLLQPEAAWLAWRAALAERQVRGERRGGGKHAHTQSNTNTPHARPCPALMISL